MITTLFALFIAVVIILRISFLRWGPDASRFYPTGKLIVLGHRGYSKSAHENTIGAIKSALSFGADGAEVDIRQTKDGYLVLHHNAEFHSEAEVAIVIRDSNYSDIIGFQKKIADINFNENQMMPLLEDVWTKIPAGKWMNLEIKVERMKCAGFEESVIKLVRLHREIDTTLISSFNLFALRKVKKIDSTIQTGLLWDKRTDSVLWFLPIILSFLVRADALHLHLELANNRIVNACHRLGLKVNIWTVNTKEKLETVRQMNVDGIITDEIELIRKFV